MISKVSGPNDEEMYDVYGYGMGGVGFYCCTEGELHALQLEIREFLFKVYKSREIAKARKAEKRLVDIRGVSRGINSNLENEEYPVSTKEGVLSPEVEKELKRKLGLF